MADGTAEDDGTKEFLERVEGDGGIGSCFEFAGFEGFNLVLWPAEV